MIYLLPIAAILAALTSAMLYLAFCSLGRMGPVISPRRDWQHAVPIVLVAICSTIFVSGLDILLALIKLVYTVLLVKLARRTPDSLQLVRLSWLKNTQRALWGAAALLFIGLLLDVAIVLDFALFDGRHSEFLVGGMSFIVLLLLGWVSVKAGRQRVVDVEFEEGKASTTSTPQGDNLDIAYQENSINTSTSTTEFTEDENTELMAELNRLLVDEKLYSDTELNLQKLARKASVPARSVSRAVNVSTGLNISQWVNHARITAVCHLLANSDVSVSDAMFDCGFLTKSNFNREFRRIKGCNPSEWRNRESTRIS